MPRFTDKWVVDKTMFEYVSGGSCACCGFPHLFHPEGLKGLINDISDLETDAADAEFKAAQKSPWPPDMRDQVWADRVKLRFKMKKEMKEYKAFMAEIGGKEGLKAFCRDVLKARGMRRVLQMARGEISERLNSKYGIHSAFAIVLCAVVEQVANFGVTGFPLDGRSDVELTFEEALTFDRRGGFILPVAERDPETRKFSSVNEDVLDVFADLMQSMGGPKLLHRAPKKKKEKPASDGGSNDEQGGDDDEDEGGADDAEGETVPGQDGPSFRSDRRIVRLLIARYWADQIIGKYQAHVEAEKKKKEEEEAKGGGEDTGVGSKGEEKKSGQEPLLKDSIGVSTEDAQLSSQLEKLSTSS
mmetsp:Transcript_726/g.2142  ORF Transcript_726/g.2142 Transcript_726/m.2142 type:complete len:358 (-) Transcript_726:86-1159(-)|eukprot:CAMPEP_0113545782 /NCGR_PEP_ID=MMETSP0015_2-20120614/11449_1 /TAXON_ID=2838 /ORGANISM="Odontella" /LENGTH=357 /DNA_ID=CAMNT_0000446179 /DNA_START=227 /DNA_END=1300 /DNA_ORIENTATION=+ /assembly_acc=CAM_ASM_000160